MGLCCAPSDASGPLTGLTPHRIRTFKRSTDPDFAANSPPASPTACCCRPLSWLPLDDVVGLYMNPPRHAVVVSIDEKSQIQALDRTQPGLPTKRGKCATLTHDSSATVPRPCSQPSACSKARSSALRAPPSSPGVHRLHRDHRAIRAARQGHHAILDSYAAHKDPEVLPGLRRTRDGRSTSRRPRARGSTLSKASSPG